MLDPLSTFREIQVHTSYLFCNVRGYHIFPCPSISVLGCKFFGCVFQLILCTWSVWCKLCSRKPQHSFCLSDDFSSFRQIQLICHLPVWISSHFLYTQNDVRCPAKSSPCLVECWLDPTKNWERSIWWRKKCTKRSRQRFLVEIFLYL